MNTVEYLKRILENWERSTLDYLPKIFLAILVLAAFFLLARIGRNTSAKFYSGPTKSGSGISKIVATVIYFFLLVSGVFIALEILGLEQVLTKLLAGAGIIGIIAGFAFKDIASNAFAGLLLSIERPIKVGDWVELDSAYGKVVKISWLTTALENISGQEVFVPNQIIYSNTFTNFTTFSKRRIIIRSGVTATNDLAFVKSVAMDEIKKGDYSLENEEVDFYYTTVGNSGFNFELSFWVRFNTENDYQQAMSDTIMRIKKRFENEKITLA